MSTGKSRLIDADYASIEMRMADQIEQGIREKGHPDAVAALNEYLAEPPPEEEAAQRLAGTYRTRNEKKGELFGALYGQAASARALKAMKALGQIPVPAQTPRKRGKNFNFGGGGPR